MPQYRYKGRNLRGAVVKGLAAADNITQLKFNLRKNGIWITHTSVKVDLFQTKLRSYHNYKVRIGSIYQTNGGNVR